MSVKVLSASAVTALIPRADVKTRLGIAAATTTYDDLIDDLIADASSQIAEFLGRPLARQQYLETVSGGNRARILLSRFPVDRDSVTLTIDDTADTDFTVEDPDQGVLYRDGSWPINTARNWPAERPEENIAITYKAGWVLPDQIAALANASYTTAQWVRPASPVGDLLMQVTTAGSSGTATEPTWPTTAGDTVTVGTVVFTARHAIELPRAILSVCWLLVRRAWTATKLLAGVRSISSDGQTIEYQASDANIAGLSDLEMNALLAFRSAA